LRGAYCKRNASENPRIVGEFAEALRTPNMRAQSLRRRTLTRSSHP